MIQRSTLFALILMILTQSSASAGTGCFNLRSDSTAGQTEKIVYKTYTEGKNDAKELKIAVVRPVDNLGLTKRPLVIGVQGSGFLNTCFPDPCYVRYSDSILRPFFAPQGFVTASVQYRLISPFDIGDIGFSDKSLKDVHYKAVQDLRDAIKYIFDNADKLGVDTENVFLVGTSAGAITSLHAAYLDNDKVAKDLVREFGSLAPRQKIKGVISVSGAVYDLGYLKSGEKIPLMLVHGREDTIVPFDKGYYLGIKRLTPVFGGKAIYDEALRLGIPAKGYFYDFGHEYPLKVTGEILEHANEFIRGLLSCGEELRS